MQLCICGDVLLDNVYASLYTAWLAKPITWQSSPDKLG